MFARVLEKAPAIIRKVVGKRGLTGDTLAILHHTHGIDPETVSAVIEVPSAVSAEYHAVMELERERSRASMVRTVVMART